MTDIVATMDMAEARLLTDEVKARAAEMWEKLRALYEGGAHIALGYSSWAAYCEHEFDMKSSRAYQLLDAGRVRHLLSRARSDSIPPMVESGNGGKPEPLPPPSNERVARGLVETAPTDPDRAVRIWEQVIEEIGPDATAEQVKAIAAGHPRAEPAPPAPELTDDEKRFLSSVRRALLHDDRQAAKQALAMWRKAGIYTELDRIAKGGS